MKWLRYIMLVSLVGLVFFLKAAPVLAGGVEEKASASLEVLKDIIRIPEKGVPAALLSDAYGIAIIPGVLKVGFVVGGKYGTGILMVHEKGGGWSDPAFISLISGSFGWQIGAEATDLILIFKSKRSVEGIKKGKFTIGADASVAAGPVGRSAAAATDVQLKSEIFSYSRSRGIFAGISLEGAALQIDDDANVSFYAKKEVRADDIFSGRVSTSSDSIKKLKNLLAEYSKMSNK
jgi:lipid-binding SYLF domain-containing protein